MRRKRTTVSLLSVQFFWQDSSVENSGIPILPNDWGWRPEHRSTVAYSIADTKEAVQNGNISILARFHKNSAGGRVQIRTRNVELDPKDVMSFQITKRYPGENALGNVAPSTIFFSKDAYSVYRGKNTMVPLKLENTEFQNLGVGIYDVNWKWEFRELDEEASEEKGEDVWEEEWRNIRTSDIKVPRAVANRLEMTKHRVYVLLDSPNFPWTPTIIPDFSQGMPFRMPLDMRMLDIACLWGKGAKTKAEAAKMITDQLFASGRFTYNTNSNYLRQSKGSVASKLAQRLGKSDPRLQVFYLSKAMERLHGGYGFGEKANCMDCALIVSAIANSLGCHLQIGKFQNMPDLDASDADHYEDNRFEVNPILAIGKESVDATMSGLLAKDGGHFFSYHTVAWLAPEGSEGIAEDFENPATTIFDACVQFPVEAGSDEYASATNLPLGGPEHAGSYIYHLAKDSDMGRPRCKPQPITVSQIQIS